MTCPNCQYERGPHDQGHPDICPACGIAINKWRPPQSTAANSSTPSDPANLSQTNVAQANVAQTSVVKKAGTAAGATAMSAGLRAQLLTPAHDGYLWPRAIVWFLLLLWTGWFVINGIDWHAINHSFMHLINLPFHEFGHLAFMPFGRFMSILGGSLFQVLVPLALTGAFVWQYHNNFAASVCLWWCGQTFVDLSPYIQDAPYRSIPLIGGMGPHAHDWGNLLTMTNSLGAAGSLAKLSFLLGVVIMGTALFWGLRLLLAQKREAG